MAGWLNGHIEGCIEARWASGQHQRSLACLTACNPGWVFVMTQGAMADLYILVKDSFP